MALKKSDLYSSLWASCDELRGGMDASQYKDYVLFMLFIKYISDKYGNSADFAPPVTIPKGASFADMVALKGKPDIGDKINTQVIQPLIEANARLARSDLLVCEGGEVGRAAIWHAPIEECYYQKALHRLRPLRGMSSHFMAATLELWSRRGVLENYVTQTSIAHLPREKFIEIPIFVPPIEEQSAIAAVLYDMDAELAAIEARRDKTRALKQAMMQELLTGRTRLV